jgi:hypothetical protein
MGSIAKIKEYLKHMIKLETQPPQKKLSLQKLQRREDIEEDEE